MTYTSKNVFDGVKRMDKDKAEAHVAEMKRQVSMTQAERVIKEAFDDFDNWIRETYPDGHEDKDYIDLAAEYSIDNCWKPRRNSK